MKSPNLPKLLIIAATCALHFASCRPASYEIIKGRKGNSTGTPRDFGEPQPPASQDPGTPTNLPPTARVEVVLRGESVVRVRVNEPTEIRPSFDTVDADDVGTSACANPGIVKADYNIANEANRTVARTTGCEPLSTPYTFTRTGNHVITMVVTTDEGETATASMTLTVIGANQSTQTDGGFTIRARPMIAGIAQAIDFVGTCNFGRQRSITWDFNDGNNGTGARIGHSYAATGQYYVTASCTDETGRSKEASLTIVVIDGQIIIPGDPGDIDVDEGGLDSSGGDDCTPGQAPGQKPNQSRYYPSYY